MAELLGAVASGITIAALFKTCVAAFDLVQHSKNQDADFHKLMIRFNIEKCRLWLWGEAMGLSGDSPAEQGLLEKSPFQALIRDTLQAVIDTFNDTQKMKSRYGCKAAVLEASKGLLIDSDDCDRTAIFLESVSTFGCPARGTMKALSSKMRWLIHDRKKFPELIQEAKTFIDGLQDITKALSSAASQERLIKQSIQQVKDTDTLELLTEAAHQDYPELSDAASNRVEALTMAPEERTAIEAWVDRSEGPFQVADADLEPLTMTELKLRLKLAEVELGYLYSLPNAARSLHVSSNPGKYPPFGQTSPSRDMGFEDPFYTTVDLTVRANREHSRTTGQAFEELLNEKLLRLSL